MDLPFGADIFFALLAARLPAHPASRIAAALAEVTVRTGVLFEARRFLQRVLIHTVV
jgi:hypothetical protein